MSETFDDAFVKVIELKFDFGKLFREHIKEHLKTLATELTNLPHCSVPHSPFIHTNKIRTARTFRIATLGATAAQSVIDNQLNGCIFLLKAPVNTRFDGKHSVAVIVVPRLLLSFAVVFLFQAVPIG